MSNNMLEIRMFNGKKLLKYSPNLKLAIRALLFFKRIDGLSVMTSGLSNEELNDISDFHKINAIFLRDCQKSMKFEFLKKLVNLKDLTIDGCHPVINLSDYPFLERLSLTWKPNVFEHIASSGITELDMWGYDEKNIFSIKDFHCLKKLSLYQSNFESLDGIENFKNLEELNLFLNKKLIDTSSLSITSLKKITIENSKKISDFSFLEKCTNLEEIKIHESSPIQSLSFAYKLNKLKSLRFVGTTIVDGDMSPLLDLEDFYFENRKHYSHKYEDIA